MASSILSAVTDGACFVCGKPLDAHSADERTWCDSAPFNVQVVDPTPLQLLAAVLEAIDIPHAATVGDEAARRELLEERAMHAAITLRRVLEQPPTLPLDLDVEVAYLREQLAKCPPTSYRHFQAPDGDAA